MATVPHIFFFFKGAGAASTTRNLAFDLVGSTGTETYSLRGSSGTDEFDLDGSTGTETITLRE